MNPPFLQPNHSAPVCGLREPSSRAGAGSRPVHAELHPSPGTSCVSARSPTGGGGEALAALHRRVIDDQKLLALCRDASTSRCRWRR